MNTSRKKKKRLRQRKEKQQKRMLTLIKCLKLKKISRRISASTVIEQTAWLSNSMKVRWFVVFVVSFLK
jgi:hypothetical protein